MMSDRVLGGVGLALAAFYAWAATIIPEPFSSDAIGPDGFPIILAIVLAISSLYFVLKPDPDPQWPALNRLAELGFALLVMFAYAQVLPVFGFVFSTIIITAYLTWRLGAGPMASILNGIGTSIGLFVIFELLFGLSLADGPLGF
ncbi:putative tricarboxylic transport membrane protein [Tranquillimonas rosea]|uniref:Putative tricarboxylic transport membrane protein n=1 Tax=Tranquillimonas rosea TaxID=641238 RepID=A0A1H9WUC9_9RHOB|nr:tripartite tricarboxylate transporter TctB family protein [Tranquillimonas rosea]SES37526.1 putative tricarboxylic transport membrane protein [Tranquillimonas rosea]